MLLLQQRVQLHHLLVVVLLPLLLLLLVPLCRIRQVSVKHILNLTCADLQSSDPSVDGVKLATV
jgi:hypothetical protein